MTPEGPRLFLEKQWGPLQSLLAKDSSQEARFVRLWCQLELRDHDAGLVSEVRAFFDDSAQFDEWALEGHWGLWSFRRRFGPSALLAWGVHEGLMSALWRLTAARHRLEWRGRSTSFEAEWVSEELRAYLSAVPLAARPEPPWQLGGRGFVLDRAGEERLRVWARERAAKLRPLDDRESSALEALREARDAELQDVERPFLAGPLLVFQALSVREPLPEVCHALGTAASLCADLETQRALAARLDATLQLLEARAHLPAHSGASPTNWKRVVFRKTPRRSLDVVIVELKSGGLGVLARHLVRRGEKQQPGFTWTEGPSTEALAAVPDVYFAEAVRLVQPAAE